ncbi:hypothetical protein WDW86_04665, partial [Bdellovibrionota bacterium FG-2]
MDATNPAIKPPLVPHADTRPAVIFGCLIFAVLASLLGFSLYFISKQFSEKTRAYNIYVNERTSEILENHFEQGKDAGVSFYFRPKDVLKTHSIRAITIYPKNQPKIRILREAHDPDYISENELSEIDRRFPPLIARIKNDETELSAAPLKSGLQIIRLLTRLEIPGSPAATIDYDELELATLLAPTPSMQIYLFSPSSKIILHSNVSPELLKEDNSHLTAIAKIRALADHPQTGDFDFREQAGRPNQYAAFQKLDFGGLTLVTQTSSTPLRNLLAKYTALGSSIAIFWAFLFSGLFHHLFIKRKWGTLMLAAANAPPISASERVEAKKKKDLAPSRPKKFNSALILSIQLEGLEEVIRTTDAKNIAKLMSSFFEKVEAIFSECKAKSFWRLGNSLVALWGIPSEGEGDGERALDAASQLKLGIPHNATREFPSRQKDFALHSEKIAST